MRRWLVPIYLGATLLGFCLVPVRPVFAESPFITQEIRYHLPEAGEVRLIWGINGWNTLPEETQLAGTVIKDKLMRTEMIREGDTFSAKVRVPAGATINFGFLITKTADGHKVSFWEDITDYHLTPASDGITHIRLTTQEVRYYLPGASKISLVWGVNDWQVIPELLLPGGTIIKDKLMYTPMRREDDTFVTRVRLPIGATLDYKFLITKVDNSEVWDANGEKTPAYHTPVLPGDVIGIKGTLILEGTNISGSFPTVGIYLLTGILIIVGLGIVLYFLPLSNPQVITMVLLGLTLLGLSLRLWVAWETRQHSPDWSSALSGNELSYLDLADAIRQGSFLQGSERMPIYPLFLAACYLLLDHSYASVFYIQAGVGAVAIGLTFLLARYFTGPKLSLLAAALVALHPTLIWQVTRFSAEILYTSLLMLAVWGLLWALAEPQPTRFLIAGLLLAAATLCSPVTLLFPMALLLLLPRGWSFKRKAALTLGYTAATLGILLFLSYRNYRTEQTFSLTNTFGTSLWWGSPELYFLMQEQQPIAQIWDWYLNPASNGGHDAFSNEGNRYFAHRALDSISTYPDIYALYSLLKLPFFWIGHPTLDWPDYTIFNIEAMRPYFSVPHIAGILAARILPLFALIGIIALHEVHGQVYQVKPLLLLCGYFMFIYALTYPEIRYSEPLHPLLIIMIATAIRPKEYVSFKLGARIRHQPYYTYRS